ncbi:MAG TPA: hypothetical protein VFI61_00285 [Patescibacteria group bacterium]|nr:hypothetical protein [Patescibacteria group bacterium]
MGKIFKKISSIFDLSFIDSAAQNPIAFEKAKTIVQFFYYSQVPLAFINFLKLGAGDPQRSGFFPIWPMSWVGSLPYPEVARIVFLFYLLAGFVATLFWSRRFAKILVFLAIFQIHALDSSFGYINHFFYLWLYVSFLFMFLPDTPIGKKISIEVIKKFLFVYWASQAVILLTYSFSGFWKIYWGIVAIFQGAIGSFSPYALSTHIAKTTIMEGRAYYFSNFMINNPIFSWFFFLGTLYIEFFSLWVAFKPNLHKVWGVVLISMHVGILLAMGIPFFESIVILCILMLNSPFAKEVISLNDILKDLPILNLLYRSAWFQKKI